MRMNRNSRPTYQYQATRHRQVWQATFPWQSFFGSCTAISRDSDDTFFVLVQNRSSQKWLPIEKVLTEAEVNEWLRRCRRPG
jgi:hypothetical protein